MGCEHQQALNRKTGCRLKDRISTWCGWRTLALEPNALVYAPVFQMLEARQIEFCASWHEFGVLPGVIDTVLKPSALGLVIYLARPTTGCDLLWPAPWELRFGPTLRND